MSLEAAATNNRFVHSIKVPRIYKTASSIIKRVVENGESLKQLVYSTRHKNIKGVYALVVETIKNSELLDNVLKKSKLLQKESRLEPWLARILLTEMLIRKKELKGGSKPIRTVLSYQQTLEKFLTSSSCDKALAKVKIPRYVRVNTLRNTPDEVVKLFRDEGWAFVPPCPDYETFLETVSELKDWQFTKDFHVKELLVFPSSAQFYRNELYKTGKIILQDKASCLPVFLLRPRSHSTVLDMCAAPGLKTSHLCARMRNKGTVHAVELKESRYKTLCEFLENTGCTNVKTVNMDALLIGRENEAADTSWNKDVEYILVDPSCSGTGIVHRRNIFVNERIDQDRLRKLCAFQFKLLLHALTNFPKAKRVVYSTCSLEAVENEKVVEDVLTRLRSRKEEEEEESPRFELVEAMKDVWTTRGSDEFEHGRRCIYADPEKDLTNGFFVAVFEREGGKPRTGTEAAP